MIILICGLPNAGKTTYAKRYEGCIHFDAIPHVTAEDQFRKCNLMASLTPDPVVEGVYNSVKRRMEFLDALQDKDGKKICIWIDTPVEVCLAREDRHRPDQVVLSHARKFEPPSLAEGWDEIIVIRGENNDDC